jgi:hypothetical protein
VRSGHIEQDAALSAGSRAGATARLFGRLFNSVRNLKFVRGEYEVSSRSLKVACLHYDYWSDQHPKYTIADEETYIPRAPARSGTRILPPIALCGRTQAIHQTKDGSR